MKKSVIVTFLVLVLLFTACSSSINNESSNSSLISSDIDLTVLPEIKPSDTFEYNDNVVNTISPQFDVVMMLLDTNEMLNNWITDIVVEGEIISTEFINASNDKYGPDTINPTTKSFLKINQVFKGNVKPGDIIVLVEEGGYVPAKLAYELEIKSKYPDSPEFSGKNSDVWAYRPMNVPISRPGEQGIYFLTCNPWMSHYYDFWINEGEVMYGTASTDKYKFIKGEVGFKVDYHGKFIPAEEAYIHWLQRDDRFPEPIYTLSDFESFVSENLGKSETKKGIRLRDFDLG